MRHGVVFLNRSLKMGAVPEVAKYLVFLALNTIIAFCGAILLAFGAILQVDEHKGVKSFAHLSIGGFSIGIGVLVFLIACLGGCALFQRKPYLISTYAVLLILVFIVQIILGAVALASVDTSECDDDNEIEKAVMNLFLRQDEVSIQRINHLQKTYRCCGVTGPSWYEQQKLPYPLSCCGDENADCEEPYEKGCAGVYTRTIERNVNIIGGVAIGFSAVEIVSSILAWFLRLSLKKSQEMEQY